MPGLKLKQFLDENKIKYVTITHSEAFTAQEVAEQSHLSGRIMAKSVIVDLDDQMAMAVLPSDRKIDLQYLRDITGSDRVKLATEDAFRQRFPDCETGAMPPFGNLYGMDVYVAESLNDNDEIAFNAGTHTETIKMAYADFDRLVKPKITSFTA